MSYYNKREWEDLSLVNVTGDLYSYADAYNINHDASTRGKEKLDITIHFIGHISRKKHGS